MHRHYPSSISGELLMAQQYNLPYPNHLGVGLRKTTSLTEQSQIKCLNQPRHCAHYNSLRYLAPRSSANILAITQQMSYIGHWVIQWVVSSCIQTIPVPVQWLPVLSRPPWGSQRQFRTLESLENRMQTVQKLTGTYSTTRTLLYPWKTGDTTHQWAIGWCHLPHTTTYLNAEYSLTT